MSRSVWPGYAIGAGVVLAISLGIALVVYGTGLMPFIPIYLLVWIFGPLGAYTLAYGLMGRGERFYYSLWGIAMLFIALLAPAVVLGWPLLALLGILILLVVLLFAAIRLTGWRGR